MITLPQALGFLQVAKAWISARRKELLVFAVAAFFVGSAVSLDRLELSPADLDYLALALLLLVLAPLGIAYGALNMAVMARGAGCSVSPGEALRIASYAQVAEFLPLPGGALVRGGALMQRGSDAGQAAVHVLVNAVLWVACAACAAAAAVGPGTLTGAALGLGGLSVAAGCTIWLARRAGRGLAALAVATRLLGLALLGVRIMAGFAVIGIAIHLPQAFPFVLASVLGSASSIAPGGLGISEALAAVLAPLVTVAPGAAFLAVGINRLAGLLTSGIAAAGFAIASARRDEAHG